MLGKLSLWISKLISRLTSSSTQGTQSPSLEFPPSSSGSASYTNLNLPKIRQMVAFEESKRNTVYKDSEGWDTIGIGHLVDERKGGSLPHWAQSELNITGRLSDESVYRLFDEDLEEKDSELRRRAPWVAQLDEVRYACLLDMSFQMGVDGLLGFKNTLSMVRSGDYSGASEGMKHSLWYKQTPNRANRRRAQMLTGKWGKIG